MGIINSGSKALKRNMQGIVYCMRKLHLNIFRKRAKNRIIVGRSSGIVVVGKRINADIPEPSISYEDYQRLIKRLDKYEKHSD